ncbi:hypothetical protein PIB30_040880 [Stylosanthes scabra]|uniref:RNase H type-1 domain-containing protein n=1 Tax=Stylosanthes scabra TaxID=79078 RepID=A0ABU6TEF3_9FABA|nr:hypothetical protein [Stylosanthes scabra]
MSNLTLVKSRNTQRERSKRQRRKEGRSEALERRESRQRRGLIYLIATRDLSLTDSCPRCNLGSETILHCLWDCIYVKEQMAFLQVVFNIRRSCSDAHNWDASAFEDLGCAGFDCVIRNSRGEWVKGCFGSLPPWEIYRCEIFAIWRELVIAIECGCHTIICETDSLDAFLACSSSNEWGMHIDLVYKIRELLLRSCHVSFSLIARE